MSGAGRPGMASLPPAAGRLLNAVRFPPHTRASKPNFRRYSPMRQDKLTSQFQQALADAQSLALGRDHQLMGPAHVLLSLLDAQGGSVRPVLVKAGADVNKLRSDLGGLLDRLPKVEGAPGEIH